MTPSARGNPRDDATRGLVFCHMWVLGGVLHMVHRADLLAGPIQVLAAVAALLFFTHPRRLGYFLVYIVVHGCLFLAHAPDTGNHELFMFMVELALLVAWVIGRSRTFESWFATVAPIIRLATLLLYFFAVFHKLNGVYFMPDSCGAVMPWRCLSRLVAPFGDPKQLFMPLSEWPQWLGQAGIYGSLFLEAAIPVLLALRRTWLLGFIAGFGLHFFLGLCFFWHFTGMLWSLYFVFAPPHVIASVVAATRAVIARARLAFERCGLRVTRERVLLAALVALSITELVVQASPELRLELARYARGGGAWSLASSGVRTWLGWVPFVLYSLGLLWVVLRACRQRPFDASGGSLWRFPNRSLAAVFAALLLLNGFAPYLGFKDHQSFAMFSGLETHGGRSNHLFMPLIEIVDHQRDFVHPLTETRTIFGRDLRKGPGRSKPYRALLREVRGMKASGLHDIHVEFRRGDQEVISDAFERDPRYVADEPSWLAWKFLVFRPLPGLEDSHRCDY